MGSSQNVAPVNNSASTFSYITFYTPGNYTGSVTNSSTLAPPGTYPAISPGSATGISVLRSGTTLSGNIVNSTSGVITAQRAGINIGEGITRSEITANAGAVLKGSITNSGLITSGDGIFVTGSANPLLLSTVTGSIINAAGGKISDHDAAISVAFATVGGSITNAGTITGTGGVGINFTFSDLGSTGSPGSGNIVNATGAIIASTYIGIIVNGNTKTAGVGTTIAGSLINDGTITVQNLFTHAGLEVAAATVLGGVTNTGTINGGVGIMAFGATDQGGPARIASIAGDIVNRGQINALSTAGSAVGIWILGSKGGGPAIVGGSIMNSGTVSVTTTLTPPGTPTGTNDGILLAGTHLVGGITNSNTISVSGEAVNVGIAIAENTSANFAPDNSSIGGSIVNQGAITAGTGIFVSAGSMVAGSISNMSGGTITGTLTGIMVSGSGGVIGGITNGGDLSGSVVAIDVSGEGRATTITQTGGAITGDILLSSLGDTVVVTGGAINGDIDGTGTSGTVDFTLGTGTFTYSNMITGVHAVNFNSGTVVLDGAIDPATLTIAAPATLVIGSSSASLDPGIIDDGTFGFDQSGAFSYGVIAGSGAVQQIGTGTTTLTGEDSVLGGTDIAAGTLELGSGGSITGNATFTGDAATLRFDTGTNQLGGIIAGAVTGDAINLRFQSFATGDHAVWLQNGSTGTLTIETASNLTLAALTLAGQYISANFEVSADAQNDVLINLVAPMPPTVDFFWDGTTTVADGIVHGGNGTWDNVSTNWTNSAGTANAPWQGISAVFEGATGTVNVVDTTAYQSLQFSTDGYVVTASGSGALTPTGIAPIIVDGLLTATISAPITGSGGINKDGLGTLILIGNDTNTGGTTITAGTLQLGNGGTSGAIVGDVDDSGTLAFDRSDNVTFGGAISGTGGLQQISTGAIILTANDSYSGGTTILAGSLQLGNGGTSGSIVGDVDDSGTLAFDRSDNVTFVGMISGSGAVQQIGGGTTTLTGEDSVLGGTDIAAGTLELGSGGSITGNATFTGNAATLRFDTGTNQLGGIIAGAVTGDAINLRFQSFATGDHAVWLQNGSTGTLTIETASNLTLAALTLAGQYTSANFEVNADTQNDVLINLVAAGPINFPHASPSNVDEWILANGQWTASAQPGSIPSGYQVAGTGDFTGNGTSDILWQNPMTGDTQEWLINNGAWNGTVELGVHPGNYQIAGVGDFFGNGIDDVLWTSTSSNGQVQTDIWKLNSSGQWQASVQPGPHPAGYNVVAVGDFTGNGTSDILWQNPTTGDVDEWQMANGQWSSSTDLGSHPGAGWTIAGVGDFTGNGIDDVLWVGPDTGPNGWQEVDIWQLGSNGQWVASITPGLGIHPPGYNVVGIGNFTGSGVDGVLWYDPTNGNVDEWVLNNSGQWAQSIDLGTHPGNFQIAGTGAFVNGNSTSDILWHSNT